MSLSLLTKPPADGVAVVVASGEVDLASAEALERETTAALVQAETAEVVVDLSGVTFLDSSGISALVKQRRLADEHGKLMRISGARGTVRDVLRLTGVWQHLGARDA
jgi:anti-anti-sigma factor